MIATDLIAALWKRKSFIALFVALALLTCYGYLTIKQNYTASVYIKYLDHGASEGITSNGSTLDPYEIADPYIVGKALEQLGRGNSDINAMAQRIKVIPVYSSAEQKKYASWIDEFSDYEDTEEKRATPLYYRIELHSMDDIEFSKAFLINLVHQYRIYYTEQYVGYCDVAVLNKSTVLSADYYNSVDLMRSEIKDITWYLNDIAGNDHNYRSPVTGYSLLDLVDAFQLLSSTQIASVSEYILVNGISKDLPTLMAELQLSAASAQASSDENAAKAETQKEMMLLYAEKNQEYVSTVISPEDYDSQIFGEVERDKEYIRDFSTYDQMILDYVSFAAKSADLLIDKACIEKDLEIFVNSSISGTSPDEEISMIYDQYADLLDITKETLEGYNTYKAGRVVMQASGIRIAKALPDLLYYMISGIFAVCICCGLIVIDELKKMNLSEENE